MSAQKTSKVFIFDLDNTLIKTDKANNLAYAEAIRLVMGKEYTIDPDKRFTRNELKKFFPSLSHIQFENIITHKERVFESYIDETFLNKNLLEILKRLHRKGELAILLTNCHSRRAIQLCSYYNLSQYFVQHFYYEDCLGDKYSFLKSLGYDLQSVVLFENDEDVLEAVGNGISLKNIIKVDF